MAPRALLVAAGKCLPGFGGCVLFTALGCGAAEQSGGRCVAAQRGCPGPGRQGAVPRCLLLEQCPEALLETGIGAVAVLWVATGL